MRMLLPAAIVAGIVTPPTSRSRGVSKIVSAAAHAERFERKRPAPVVAGGFFERQTTANAVRIEVQMHVAYCRSPVAKAG